MTFVMWQDKLATGIEEIDNDHKMLFDLIEQFHEAYISAKGSVALEAVFTTLMEYTGYHFKREEELLKNKGYPKLADHHQSHEDLKTALQVLYQRFLKDERLGQEKDLELELLAFMKNWLDFHIIEEDMEYRDFIQGER